MKIFVSYTSSDRDWAYWIGWHLNKAGHEAFVHGWEIGAGENIAGWMEDSFRQAEKLIGVFSDAYCKAAFSQSERWSAYWQDPRGQSGFLVPIEVRKVREWPGLVGPLNRLSLLNLSEDQASQQLIASLRPPQQPTEKPTFPGPLSSDALRSSSFTAGGDPIGVASPVFPASPPLVHDTPSLSRPPLADPNITIRCIDDHEPRPVIFGREGEIETVVTAFLEGRFALVAGGPGMGKTALATVALYDKRVVAHFGRRRVFTSVETATEPRAILAKLVESLGLSPVGDEPSLLRVLETNAAEQPFAAILDNAETVFDIDRVESERLLSLVGSIKGLSIAVTIRGIAPPIPNAVSIADLQKLSAGSAKDAFLEVAGATFEDDPDLLLLLEALDGHALSIHLVAAQAIGLPSLRGLRESWDDAHAEILRASGEQESRLTSVRASLALSLNTRRMRSTPLARRLVSLLAFLPGGLADSNVRSLLGERGTVTRIRANEAVQCLHQLRLVERRPDLRLRMLTPLRECVRIDIIPLQADQGRLVEKYLDLANKAGNIASLDWEKFSTAIEAEVDNLDAICGLAVTEYATNRHLNDALYGLARFNIYSGRGGVGSVHHAAEKFSSNPLSPAAVQSIFRVAEIAYARSDYGNARASFDKAIPLCRRNGNVRGEAYCILNLGNIALSQSDRETAQLRYEEALALSVANSQTQADCVFGLGMIALGRSDNDLARTLFDNALVLYKGLGDALGEANIFKGTAELAIKHSDFDVARARSEEGLQLYRRIGSVLGEATCIMTLGDIAFGRSDLDTALLHFDEARFLARHIGAMSSEAGCCRYLGLIAFARFDYERAATRFQEALALAQRAGDILNEAETMIRLGQAKQKSGDSSGLEDNKLGFSQYFGLVDTKDRARAGWQAMQLALTISDRSEAGRQRESARSAWTAVGRLDLVRTWADVI